MQASEVLKKYWNYNGFRPGQDQIVDQIVAGNNVLAVLPTGGGKSICFQVPGLILGGVTMVVSPLIALMKDQVEQLHQRQIGAVALHSHLNWREQKNLMEQVLQGQVNFLYVSPERLASENFREYLPNLDIRLLVIDEAHCISQWGYDFRPPYLKIAEIYEYFGNRKVPVCAFTASATDMVRKDIVSKLELIDVWEFIGDFNRPNLNFGVFNSTNKNGKLLELCRKIGGSSIIFVNSRRETEELASFLETHNISAEFYHAGLPAQMRSSKQEKWMQNRKRVMVCTNAFGMGVDKPDVQLVVHIQPSLSPEAYYQEAGRAGRNGNTAWCILLFEEHDFEMLFLRLKQSYVTQAECGHVYNAVLNYLAVPPGTGAERSFELNLEQIAQHYKVDVMRLYNGIKALETIGIWNFVEADWSPSKVMLKASQAEVYSAKVKYPKLVGVINYILRNYSGVFDQYVRINELAIAKYLHTDESDILNKLDELTKLGVLDYIPKNENSKLYLPHERTVYVDFDTYALKQLYKTKVNQLKIMQSYCVTPGCRSNFWENYFVQKQSKPCGHCDNCKKSSKNAQAAVDNKIISHIKKQLQQKPCSQKQLLGDLKNAEFKLFLVNLRWLIDNKMVKHNHEGNMEWVKK